MCDITTKVCRVCGEEKPLTKEYFTKRKDSKDGFRNDCKDCRNISTKKWRKEYNKEYWKKNKEKLSQQNKEYHLKNRDTLLKKMKDRRLNNIEYYKDRDKKYYEKNREYILQQRKKYVNDNKDLIYSKNRDWVKDNIEDRREYLLNYVKDRMKKDNIFRLRTKISDLVRGSFKRQGWTKNTKTQSIIGCDWSTFKEHIENQFQEGMTWDNHGEWHYDHIIPISSAKTEEEVYKLNHYTNFQPLWAEDNLRKSDKISEEWNNIGD